MGGGGGRGGRQRQPSVLPCTFLASSESLAAFKNFTEEERGAPGRRLRSRCAARGVGCRPSPAGVDAVRPFGSGPALERLAWSLSLRRLLCLQACSGPSGSPSTLAPQDLRGALGGGERMQQFASRVPPPPGRPPRPPTPFLPPLWVPFLPSPPLRARKS